MRSDDGIQYGARILTRRAKGRALADVWDMCFGGVLVISGDRNTLPQVSSCSKVWGQMFLVVGTNEWAVVVEVVTLLCELLGVHRDDLGRRDRRCTEDVWRGEPVRKRVYAAFQWGVPLC